MGITGFFSSLLSFNKNITNNNKILCDEFYIDFNAVICIVTKNLETELNYLLYEIIIFLDNKNNKIDEKAQNIANKYNFSTESISINKFKNYFTQCTIFNIALKNIIEYINYILYISVDTEKIKKIFISIDGIPQMSKLVEQKRRKYTSYLISKISKNIFNEYKNKNMLSNIKTLYEENKLAYDKNKFINWSTFMDDINKLLTSIEFDQLIKAQCPNINEIVLTLGMIPGEGEKKIINHIIKNSNVDKKNYVVFSPDSDLIILALIGLNVLSDDSNFNIIRHNNNNNSYDYIDVKQIGTNIYEYIKDNKNYIDNNYEKIDFDRKMILNDVSFIFSMFGNDFIPKIQSLDVRNDIETLLLAYGKTIRISKSYIIEHCSYKYKYKINYKVLHQFIKMLRDIEYLLMKETYLRTTYKNYNYVKKQLNCKLLFESLKLYVYNANYLFDCLRDIYYEKIEKNINDVDFELFLKDKLDESYVTTDISFVRNYLNIECDYEYENINYNDFTDDIVIDKFLENIKKIFSGTNGIHELVKGKLKLVPYEKIIGNYHEKIIQQNKIHPQMIICDYDREIYCLQKKIGKYNELFNGIEMNTYNYDRNKYNNIGEVKLRLRTDSKDFKYYGNYELLFKENESIRVKDYYKNFFGSFSFKDTNKNNHNKLDIKSITKEYIKGLFWTFDYYFNNNDLEENLNTVSTWSYPYNKAPFLVQIEYFLRRMLYNNDNNNKYKNKNYYNKNYNNKNYNNKNYNNKNYNKNTNINSLFRDIFENQISRKLYLTKLEQYLYVTPNPDIFVKSSMIMEKYIKIIDKNPDIFPNLDQMINDFENTNNNKLNECWRTSILNKCNLLTIKHVSFNDFIKIFSNIE
jgi:5'-3' exonuclease